MLSFHDLGAREQSNATIFKGITRSKIIEVLFSRAAIHINFLLLKKETSLVSIKTSFTASDKYSIVISENQSEYRDTSL